MKKIEIKLMNDEQKKAFTNIIETEKCNFIDYHNVVKASISHDIATVIIEDIQAYYKLLWQFKSLNLRILS